MITFELIKYIREQKTAGVPVEKISNLLRQQGWTEADIKEAFNAIDAASNLVSKPKEQDLTPITPISPATPLSPATTVVATPPVVPLEVKVQKRGHPILKILMLVVVLGLVGAGGWYAWKHFQPLNPKPVEELVVPKAPVGVEGFEQMKIERADIVEQENSAVVFNALPSEPISKVDKAFLDKYFLANSIVMPPLSESKKILTRYNNLLTAFKTGTGKLYYQCSVFIDKECKKNILRDVAKIGALQSLVFSQEGNKKESQEYADRVIKLGSIIPASSKELVDYLVGLAVQKIGYLTNAKTNPGFIFSKERKDVLVKELRDTQKNMLKFEAQRIFEIIDYITDTTKIPSSDILEFQEGAQVYRDSKTQFKWDPTQTKNYIYQSLLIDLANVDLSCGSEYKDSKIDLGVLPQTEEEAKTVENYLGKKFYQEMYVSGNAVNNSRCEVETLINVI